MVFPKFMCSRLGTLEELKDMSEHQHINVATNIAEICLGYYHQTQGLTYVCIRIRLFLLLEKRKDLNQD